MADQVGSVAPTPADAAAPPKVKGPVPGSLPEAQQKVADLETALREILEGLSDPRECAAYARSALASALNCLAQVQRLSEV